MRITIRRGFCWTFFVGVMMIVISLTSVFAQAGSTECTSWHDRILRREHNNVNKVGSADEQLNLDSSLGLPFNEMSEHEVFKAMECLLKLKGNKRYSRFAAATRPDVSENFDAPTAEVAALYYISYLFLQKWDHGSAILLIGKDGGRNGIDAIEAAYRSYKLWLTKLRAMGLTEARRERLDPLNNTDVRWY